MDLMEPRLALPLTHHQVPIGPELHVRNEIATREATRMRAAHAQRLQALGQLASGIAHDFNNILQAVAGAASLIEHGPSDTAAVAKSSRILNDAISRGAAITRRLLVFAHYGEPCAEPVDLAVLLSGIREILMHTLGGMIQVRFKPPPIVPPVVLDRRQLETVVVNLASNARDAMPAGGMITLAVSHQDLPRQPAGAGCGAPSAACLPSRYVRISVSDTGTGMDAATLTRVEEPFFTTKPPGEGTGLGLSMARAFATQSNGWLSIDSQPGRGTTVSIWLPVVAEAPADSRPGVPRATRRSALSRGRASARVLLVDDDALVFEAMHGALVDAGFDVVAVSAAQAALALLETTQPFDVLVTDMSMPRMDGLRLIRALHAQRPNLPSILMTGFPDSAATATMAVATGGRMAVMRKPVSTEALTDRIIAMLASTRSVEGPQVD
jgi:signal transduction histidine kinase/CheY-like chemotaxis protein